MKLKIRKEDDPCLREKSELVKEVGILERLFIDSLFDTLRDYPGWGLAAPQVGVNRQIFVITISRDRMAIINPKILSKSGESICEEGCLSIPNRKIKVKRAESIEVEFLDVDNKIQVMKLSGVFARVFQHEADHLQGVLITDYLEVSNEKAIV